MRRKSEWLENHERALSWNREGEEDGEAACQPPSIGAVRCRRGRQRALLTVRAAETPGPPKLFSAKPCQSPKVTVFFGAEAGAHKWEELEPLLFGVAVTRLMRQPPSPLTALRVFVWLPRPT